MRPTYPPAFTGTLKAGSPASPTSTPMADQTATSPYILSSPTASSDQFGSGPTGGAFADHQGHHAPIPAIVAMAIIIPTILVGLSICSFFFCIRPWRNRQRNQPANVVAERRVDPKNVAGRGEMTQNDRAHYAVPVTAPTPAAAAGSPRSSPTSSSTSTGMQPVILTTTMNNTYYTGIDTSDHISLTDARSQASADTFGEEPPPPYRPRSVPPMSRNASVRTSCIDRNGSVRSNRVDPMSGHNLMSIRRSEDVRSPFDDPEESDEDDAASQISTIRTNTRREADRLSVVSDMSDQEEPQTTHSTL